MDKSYGFVHEQQFELQWYWSEEAMCQKLCHVAMKLGKAMKGNAKSGTQVMNSPFGKKSDFEFNVRLVEEIIPSDSNVWNHWSGNGNSGMDAVAQGNGIDKTQLSNSHRKQPKKRTWKSEPIWNPIHGMEESAELNENGLQDDLIGVHDFRDNLSVTRTQMCSFKVPTTATWSNGSCNGPATLFKTMWTRYELCGILEVSFGA